MSNNVFINSDSEDSDMDTEEEDDSLGSIDDIISNGGRKPMTNKMEAMYVRRFNNFLKSEGLVSFNSGFYFYEDNLVLSFKN